MPVESLLNRLQRVKPTGKGRCIASSPTREDKMPSLAIRELDDGSILLHDFGGATPQEVLDAVGLTFSDLFPAQITSHSKPEKRAFYASDILKIIQFEVRLVLLCAHDLAKGRKLKISDFERIRLAVTRINHAIEVANGY